MCYQTYKTKITTLTTLTCDDLVQKYTIKYWQKYFVRKSGSKPHIPLKHFSHGYWHCSACYNRPTPPELEYLKRSSERKEGKNERAL